MTINPQESIEAMQTAMATSKDREVKPPSDSKFLEILFMSSLAASSILFGFGMTLALAKKKDPTMFDKGLIGPSTDELSKSRLESGGRLAMRALGWGTLCAIGGVGLFSWGVWKLIGAKDLYDFRAKVGNMLPRIPKNDPPQGRTEFSSLRDLMEYLAEEGKSKTVIDLKTNQDIKKPRDEG